MSLVSVNILTKNRAQLLARALKSVACQNFRDYEVVLINDGSTDETASVIERFKKQGMPLRDINHEQSKGKIFSRNEALKESSGKYVAPLDDDDEWVDEHKLQKQVDYFQKNPDAVLTGGGIIMIDAGRPVGARFRAENDKEIRPTMLLRNNFFTSTVMFKREEALKSGGFLPGRRDEAEDYGLWLRLGKQGKMYNFQEVFTNYTVPHYNKERFRSILREQLEQMQINRAGYPNFHLAKIILKLRIIAGF